MKEALVDVAVLLVFFTRHEQFKQVFEQVRKARPSELFLYQDGPREGRPDDMENIKKCREIAENIDWECKVHRLYQEKNRGVDPSGYLADSWAFSQTEKCIVLEDDVVPSLSFFGFCKEMLDRYENSPEVMLISGMNSEEKTEDVDTDYFFSRTTFTWGWASWGRVVRNWDPGYAFLEDSARTEKMQAYIDRYQLVKKEMNFFKAHRDSGIEHFETLLISNQYLHEGLTVVPRLNMINNVGVVADSAHYASDINLIPKGYRRIFTMKRYEMDLDNLRHPKAFEVHEAYQKRTYRIYAWGHPFVKLYRQAEMSFYYARQGKWNEAFRDIKDKFGKLKAGTVS